MSANFSYARKITPFDRFAYVMIAIITLVLLNNSLSTVVQPVVASNLTVTSVAEGDARPAWLPEFNDDIFAVGATGDGTGVNQTARIEPMLAEGQTLRIVEYDAGLRVDESSEEGVRNLHEAVLPYVSVGTPVTLIGMSQGARVVGDTVERYFDSPEFAGLITVVLLGDTRFPTGIETLERDGIGDFITFTGARPASQYVSVLSISIEGDPISDAASASSTLAYVVSLVPGFLGLHAGKVGSQNYDHLAEMQVRESWSDDATTYVVMESSGAWSSLFS